MISGKWGVQLHTYISSLNHIISLLGLGVTRVSPNPSADPQDPDSRGDERGVGGQEIDKRCRTPEPRETQTRMKETWSGFVETNPWPSKWTLADEDSDGGGANTSKAC